MGMRLPGDVRTAEEFWDFLLSKKDGLCPVPPDRYNAAAFSTSKKPLPKQGYFLRQNPGWFDAPFFSLGAHEAARMDPQQRLLLEVVWECLENAGETDWEGRDIGCYVGTFGEDWLDLRHKDAQSTDRYHALGTGAFALANHVSYKFDFRGPSMTIQTGCSSSLVGVHEACQALATDTCSAAVVAGTNLILAPTMTTTMTENMVISPNGICKTFDAKADGYGRGEAVNCLYLKKLDDAVRDNNPIRAVIRSTATNSDGSSTMISTPSSETQEKLIRTAYRNANIDNIAETGLFECHGTGTMAGDTAESAAIAAVLGGKGAVLGAVKPNFGHSEGASGITSIIKAVLSLEHKVIPPNAHFETPNPAIPFEKEHLMVAEQPLQWPADRRARVSINGFGIGGANAHVILEAPSEFGLEVDNTGCHPAVEGRSQLLLVSARDNTSLQERIDQIVDYSNAHPSQLQHLAFTLSAKRKHLSHRAFAVARGDSSLERSNFHHSHSKSAPRIHFVFTGQGAHWLGMGKAMVETYASVRSDIRLLQHALMSTDKPPSWCLEKELCRMDGTQTNDPEVCQSLCTALQIAIVNLLRSWGVEATSVIGHSSGEIAAAYTAGAITAASAITIAYFRGKLAKSIVNTRESENEGEMAGIGLSSAEVAPYLEENVVVACENSPRSVTISGPKPSIEQTVSRIRAENPDVFCRILRLGIAYHSPQMKHIGQQYQELITAHICQNSEAMVPMFSSVTTQRIVDPQELNATYWRQNLESPVRFTEAVSILLQHQEHDQQHLFVEIGPHSALSGPLKQIFATIQFKMPPVYIPTLVRDDHDCQSQLLSVVGSLSIRGTTLQLLNVNGSGKVLSDIPPYPWSRANTYWEESRLAQQWRLCGEQHHELLGRRCPEASEMEPMWRNLLRLADVPWLSEHILQSQIIFPGAGYIAIAGEAIQQLAPAAQAHGYSIKNVVFKAALLLEEYHPVEVVTSLKRVMLNDYMESDWYSFSIMSYDGTSWTKNCSGQVKAGPEEHIYNRFQFPENDSQYCRPVLSEKWYDAIARLGLPYGTHFRGLESIRADPKGGSAIGVATDRVKSHDSRYVTHPTVIDQCLQLMSVASTAGMSRRLDGGAIPVSIEDVFVGHGGNQMPLAVNIESSSTSSVCGNAVATHENHPVISLNRAKFFCHRNLDAGNRQIPLTSKTQWMPDIDFQNSQGLLRSPLTKEAFAENCQQYTEMAFLYFLETAEKLRNIVPRLPHLTKWKQLVETEAAHVSEGKHRQLFPDSQAWAEWSSPQRLNRIEYLGTLLDKTESVVVKEALGAIYNNCLGIAQGEVSVLTILLENNLLERFYESTTRVSDWDYFLRLLCHSNPMLRILEIGAGTGSAATLALKSLCVSGLPKYASYTYTDVTSAFLLPAEERFKGQRNMEFKTLDITQNPCHQGFVPHGYDLVIASNVIHATPDLVKSLENVHKLLAPGGRLLLHELNPGYGADDGRVNAPYVSPAVWDEKLKAARFTGTEIYVDDIEAPYRNSSTMISRIPRNSSAKPAVSLVVKNRTPSIWSQIVEKELTDLDYPIRWTTLDEEPTADGWHIFLLDADCAFLYDINTEGYNLLKQYLEKVKRCNLLWVTHATQMGCADPRYGLSLGLVRCLRLESSMAFYTLEVDSFTIDSARVLDYIITRSQDEGVPGLAPDYEYSFYGGNMFIPRFAWGESEDSALRASRLVDRKRLEINAPGLLDSLRWIEIEGGSLGDEEVDIDMHYVGLNFKDVMVAMGLLGSVDDLGMEGSGIVRRVGRRVTDLHCGDKVTVTSQAICSTRVVVPRQHCMKVPDGMDLSDAAAVAIVFATTIYSLLHVGALRKGQTVLIHSACGGVGIAAIQICKMIGAEVFATVGNQEKVDYLVKEMGIPHDRIFDSRSDSFRSGVMKVTNGQGVDLVLNSLAGKLLHASWDCVAPLGKMIELGKRDFLTNGTLSLKPFINNRQFIGVDMIGLLQLDMGIMYRLMTEFGSWYKEGKVHAIRSIVFDATQVVEAFRLLQKGTHIGKVVIRMPQDTSELNNSTVRPRLRLNPDASYLLVGGLGGIGRAVSTWMVEHGARHLTFLSRSAGASDEHRDFIKELEILGCHVECIAGSVTEMKSVTDAVARSNRPLKGVLHLSMSLEDRTFSDMTYDEWKVPLASKVQGTWNLHQAVAQESLDFFIAFGSLAGTCGRMKQTNYGAANTFIEAFIRYRHEQGLPSSALVLGAVGDVGFVSREARLLQKLRSAGCWVLSEAEVLEGLQLAILECCGSLDEALPSGGTSVSTALITGLGQTHPLSDTTTGTLLPPDARSAMYKHLEPNQGAASTDCGPGHVKEIIGRIERDPDSLLQGEMEALVANEVFRLILTYSAEAQEMEPHERDNIEIDSLMSIEIKNWVLRNMGLEIGMSDISKAKTVGGLVKLIMERLRAKYLSEGEDKVDSSDS
ncbi:putative polyketide synthase [Aspergillus taichungensis]|uniref:Putative polyketide synthase n=1 Tax=Aspergillus taichungensis TaxID=482145 RepID=A0A2J5I9G8_9EURO|nr:putative polyketide synthase [Aspergillus taichungensis]